MDDMISRQAAIERATKDHDFYKGATTPADKARRDELLNVMCWLGELPSAQPKHGYWIESHEHIYIANGVKEWTNWYCSECDAPNDKPTDYCPNCGARMENSDG